MAEAGVLHRDELAGALHGLLRVRMFSQDDGHLFCTPEQIEEEMIGCLDFGYAIYDRLGLEIKVELSTRPENKLGTDEEWDLAESALVRALERRGLAYVVERGRRRVLRAEDRPAHARFARPLLAARHSAARLPDAAAIRPHLSGRRQRRAHAVDDPPRADRLVRAVHRHPARALRGGAAVLARAGAGARAAGRRGPPRAGAGTRRPAALPGRGRRATRRSASGSETPRSRRFRSPSSTATRSRTRPSPSASAAARSRPVPGRISGQACYAPSLTSRGETVSHLPAAKVLGGSTERVERLAAACQRFFVVQGGSHELGETFEAAARPMSRRAGRNRRRGSTRRFASPVSV